MSELSEEEKKAINIIKGLGINISDGRSQVIPGDEATKISTSIYTILNLIEKQQKEIENAKWYAHQEIVHIKESINDFIDDDRIGNKNIIDDLKEEKAYWQDIEKLLNGQDKDQLYMDWRGFEYE